METQKEIAGRITELAALSVASISDNGPSFRAPFESVDRGSLAFLSRGVPGCIGSSVLSSAEAAKSESSVSDEDDAVRKESAVEGNGGLSGALSGW